MDSSPTPHSEVHRSDVLILGGGVIGIACALLLAREGRAVAILEQGQIGRGSSHGNCGTITPSHLPLNGPGVIAKALKWLLTPDAPLRVKPSLDPALLAWLLHFAAQCNARDLRRITQTKLPLLLASRERLEQLIRDEQLDCEFVPSGTMYVWNSEPGFAAAQAEYALLREVGIDVQRFDGDEARRREPALNERIVGGHFHPGDARLRPDRYVAALAQRAREAGCRFVEACSVQGIRSSAGRIEAVATTQGEWQAQDYVLALGAWSPLLAQHIGLDLPIQPGKGYSITYADPANAPRVPLVLKERSVCVTRWDSGWRLGSTMEFAGYDSTLNRTRLDALKRGAAQYLQHAESPVVEEEWYGWRPMTWDELPIIGRSPRHANLTLATGHGMLGISLSAITAQLVCDELCRRRAVLDARPFSPARFA